MSKLAKSATTAKKAASKKKVLLSSSDEEGEGDGLGEADLAAMDKETRKKYIRRREVCEQVMKVMDVKATAASGEEVVQETRSLKMSKQLRRDKLITLLSTFES